MRRRPARAVERGWLPDRLKRDIVPPCALSLGRTSDEIVGRLRRAGLPRPRGGPAHVRRLRVERKLTLEQLAHDAEIDLTYLGGIERGRRNPSVDVLGRLAAVFKVHPKVLLED